MRLVIIINYVNMKSKIFLILLSSVFFFSCMTTPKNIAYFQDLEKYLQNNRIRGDSLTYEPVIKKFDELLITVTDPVSNQAAVAQFNLPMTSYLTQGEIIGSKNSSVQQSMALQTYTVGSDGAISYPVFGRIHLAGLAKSQAIEKIKKLVFNQIEAEESEIVVSLKIMSFKITILGEVLKPGTITVSQEKISILDAIGEAGDLTIYANRENILLIRENDNGIEEPHRFDLTKSDLFTSPYYYLQQNDKIVVTPNKTRQLESKYGPADGYKLSMYSMVFSAISIIASTTIAIISLRK